MTEALITLTRAKYAINQSSFTATEDNIINSLIMAVSRGIERYLHRQIGPVGVDELVDGTGCSWMALKQFPLVSVERVATCPTVVMEVTNTSSANQRATVGVTETGLNLFRVASGVTATDLSVTFASNVTITALVNAVNALGNGWLAEVEGDYGNWPSAELRPQGSYGAKDVRAGLVMHVEDVTSFEIDRERGWLWTEEWLSEEVGGWQLGRKNYRVLYTAGYAAVPEDIQEACATWVSALFWQAKRDPGLAQEQLPEVSFRIPEQRVPIPAVRALLAPYRKHLI